ncbi:MAG: hypothetical protein EAX96_11185 [Candidatus Lokiarchaeota archaeon]|nr:hypothetical protein [Candidatus Lokiarchaeota archaeon]
MKIKIILLSFVLLFPMIFTSNCFLYNVSLSAGNKFEISRTASNANWHEGSATTTSEASITYTTDLKPSSVIDYNYVYYQKMSINFLDDTSTSVEFNFINHFLEEGVDNNTGTITDWDYCSYIEPHLISESYKNGYNIKSSYKFNGFDIVNGSSNNLSFQNSTEGGNWGLMVDDSIKLGRIEFSNCSSSISDPYLTTRNYQYNGQSLKESRIFFNVTLNSTIGITSDKRYIDTVLMFEIIHNITTTWYKYGLFLNWSEYKDFPTNFAINTGDDFCLVANDRLGIGTADWSISQFNVSAENDTATFIYNDENYAQQFFTKEYNILEDSTVRFTNRTYFENATYVADSGVISSRVFTCFDDFKYNQSTGINFDPSFCIPCNSVPTTSPSIPGFEFLFVIIGLAGILVLFLRKRMQLEAF